MEESVSEWKARTDADFPTIQSGTPVRAADIIPQRIEKTRERDGNAVWSGNERIETMTSEPPLADKPVTIVLDLDAARARRGTTNQNARGNAADRARRRAWLVETYRADQDVQMVDPFGTPTMLGIGAPACRCYRCGTLLTVDTVTVDRIIPGCHGGTYRRNNIRPACSSCNSITGSTTRKR
jgi:hypothetical protein